MSKPEFFKNCIFQKLYLSKTECVKNIACNILNKSKTNVQQILHSSNIVTSKKNPQKFPFPKTEHASLPIFRNYCKRCFQQIKHRGQKGRIRPQLLCCLILCLETIYKTNSNFYYRNRNIYHKRITRRTIVTQILRFFL